MLTNRSIYLQYLNNPTLPVASTSSAKPEETASQKKKRKKAERDELPLNVRSAPTTTKKPSLSAQTWKTDADEVKVGGGSSAPASKKVKTEQGGFAKPAGFEGAAKVGKKKGKGKQVYGQKSQEPEPVWGKRGEAREWDEGKESEQSDEDDDDHGVFDVEEESEESEDSDEDVEEMLMSRSSGRKDGLASAKGAAKAKFEREVDGMLRREEEGGSNKSAGGAGKGKKGKKGKQ
jgi:hypothetical protein